MKEELLHFIWKYRRYSLDPLYLTDNSLIKVLKVGQLNNDSGPDFINSKIILNGLIWVGSVEIHIKSSDWEKHNHQTDKNYNGVILHVVWQNDKTIYNQLGEELPTLVLSDYVEKGFIDKIYSLLNNEKFIPCEKLISDVDSFVLLKFLERIFIERLEYKSNQLALLLKKKINSWEEVFYQLICKSFGLKVNAMPMLHLSELLPYKLLLKHNDNLLQLEALLFGVAGFLNKPNDDYTKELSKEYKFLKKKYNLVEMNVTNWKFLRMRPNSFPTVRIAQLASFLFNNNRLFSNFLNFKNIKDIYSFFDFKTSEYWNNHYNLNKPSIFLIKKVGVQLIDNILINALVPILVLYSKEKQNLYFQEKAINLMYNLKAEKNKCSKKFKSLGFNINNAAHSQSFLHLKKFYCDQKKCLSCNIGNQLLN